jgi:hypothetical protein
MHYPVDSMAGQALGLAVGEYFVARCQPAAAAANLPSVAFNGTAYAGTQDFSGGEIYNAATGAYITPAFYTRGINVAIPGSAVLNWLWADALAEW